MKNITIRHNKHYTSVLFNTNSPEVYKEAVEAAEKLSQQNIYNVIKPSSKGFNQFVEKFKPFDKIKNRESFSIFGVKFEYINDSKTDDAIWYKRIGLQRCYKTGSGKLEIKTKTEVVGYAEDYSNLIEDVFTGITGELLYF